MLIPTGEEVLIDDPVFQVARGGGVMEYTPSFAEAHGLPGTVLSVEYVRATVIGYEQKQQRWMLGFHIARNTQENARWLRLVQWPSGDNMTYATAVQQAGRQLAEHIGCPLKIFGAKKLANAAARSAERSGVTGPLVPHRREEIGRQQVKLQAQRITLPLQHPNIWLGPARGGVTLRLAKDATTSQDGSVAPSFNQAIIDPKAGKVRLLPPTGLLGAFFSGQQAREFAAEEVRNVEMRHSVEQRSSTRVEKGGIATEVTDTINQWEVYLTLRDESLLLAQTNHVTSSDLTRQRATAGDKFAVDSRSSIEYLRQHQADQEARERAARWAEQAALVIASALDVHLVLTEVEES